MCLHLHSDQNNMFASSMSSRNYVDVMKGGAVKNKTTSEKELYMLLWFRPSNFIFTELSCLEYCSTVFVLCPFQGLLSIQSSKRDSLGFHP